MTFYQAVKHIPHSNHESDLYLLACHEARELMQQYEKKGKVFRSNVDNQSYYDIPFAYEPWWEAGIENEAVLKNSASYLDGWRKKLKADSKVGIQAAGQAQKSADYILGVKKGNPS